MRAPDPFALDVFAVHPYRLAGKVGDVPFDLTAVTPKSAVLDAPGVEVSQRLSPAEGDQGLYVYRNDHLLQLGGWSLVIDDDRDYANLRISLGAGDTLSDVVRINPEKSGIVLELGMRRAIHTSVGQDTGTSSALLASVCSVAIEGRRRESYLIRLIGPRGGLGQDVYDAIQDSVEFADAEPIRIRWKRMLENGLVEVDHGQCLLEINERHWRVFSIGSDPQGVPLLKTLIFLLYLRFFEGVCLGGWGKRGTEALERIIETTPSDEFRRRGAQEE